MFLFIFFYDKPKHIKYKYCKTTEIIQCKKKMKFVLPVVYVELQKLKKKQEIVWVSDKFP